MSDESVSTTTNLGIAKKTPYIPSELILQICRSLKPKDLKAVRLASRRFNECAEEFFITNVTLADRFGTLNIFARIMLHPVFSRTVTKITIDGSHFEYPLTKKATYIDKFFNILHHSGSQETNDMVERAIAVENSASKVRSIACATFPSSGWSEFQIDSDLQDNPSKADSSASSGRNLLSRGYIKYCQLYSEQEKIRSQAITYKRLHTALHELPNVTSLEFGDNPRSGRLVKDVGEDLMGYCHYPSSWNTVGISAPLHILPHTLIILSGTSLTSLSISCGDLWPKAWAYSSLSGRFAQDMSVHETDQPVLSQVFRSLKSLELRLHAYNGHLEEVQATSKVGDYARAAWSPLRARMCRLELASGQVAQLIGAATNLEHLLLDFGAPFSEWTLWRQLGLPDVHLQSLVGTHVWKHLASLEIVGLGMWPGEMRKFLTPQKALKRIKFHHVGVRQMRWFEAVRVLQRLGLEHIKIREPWGIDIHPYRAWADDDPWILLVEDWILRGSRDGTQPFPLM